MSTSMNIHQAVSVTYQRIQFRNFWTHRFTVTTKDGGTLEFDAFSPSPTKLEMLPDRMSAELEAEQAVSA